MHDNDESGDLFEPCHDGAAPAREVLWGIMTATQIASGGTLVCAVDCKSTGGGRCDGRGWGDGDGWGDGRDEGAGNGNGWGEGAGVGNGDGNGWGRGWGDAWGTS